MQSPNRESDADHGVNDRSEPVDEQPGCNGFTQGKNLVLPGANKVREDPQSQQRKRPQNECTPAHPGGRENINESLEQ